MKKKDREAMWNKNFDSVYPPNNTEAMPEDKGNGHTPGEWFVSQSPIQANKTGIAFKSIKTTNKIGGRIIANVYIGNGFTLTENQKKELQANAELIASAPQLKAENEKQADTIKELLEALTKVREIANGPIKGGLTDYIINIFSICEKAIQKANNQ